MSSVKDEIVKLEAEFCVNFAAGEVTRLAESYAVDGTFMPGGDDSVTGRTGDVLYQLFHVVHLLYIFVKCYHSYET